MTNEDKLPALYEALAKAQAEFEQIRPNAIGGNHSNRYADLGAIIAATRPALNRNGIALVQTVDSSGDKVVIETVLYHKDGGVLRSEPTSIPVAPGGGMNAAQARGSAITYGRRYSLAAFLGVAADDDDDGDAAGSSGKTSGQNDQTPAKFVLTQDEVDKARAAALRGVEAYKTYFEGLAREVRQELSRSGWHSQLKTDAQKADSLKGAADE